MHVRLQGERVWVEWCEWVVREPTEMCFVLPQQQQRKHWMSEFWGLESGWSQCSILRKRVTFAFFLELLSALFERH